MKPTTWMMGVAIAALAACSGDSTAPVVNQTSTEGVDLVQEMDVSSAAAMDRGGIGGSELPDSLKLTAEQKAKIAALHQAYKTANKADLDALKAIEAELKAARKAGKSREELATILAKAQPILTRLRAAFATLQSEIFKVYTPAQQTWIKAHAPSTCRSDSTLRLTDAQIQKIRALRTAFEASIKDQVAIVRQVHEEAKAARAAGKPAEEIKRILAKADTALAEIRKAELRLRDAILGVLTAEQRKNPHCVLHGLNG